MIVMIMMGAFMVMPAVSAATTRIAICDNNSNEVTSFHSTGTMKFWKFMQDCMLMVNGKDGEI